MVSLNYKLIKAKKSDFDRIYKARETVPTVDNFKYEKYKLFWHWLFFNSLNRLHFILIAVHKNKVKGHLGLVPINFLKKNKQCTGGLYCQLFVENAFIVTPLPIEIPLPICILYPPIILVYRPQKPTDAECFKNIRNI